jgi:hypothetical protein
MAVSKMHIFDPDMGKNLVQGHALLLRGDTPVEAEGPGDLSTGDGPRPLGHVGCTVPRVTDGPCFQDRCGARGDCGALRKKHLCEPDARRSAGPTDASPLPRVPSGPACGAFR